MQLKRRKIKKKMSHEERVEYNTYVRNTFPKERKDYVPIKCQKPGCVFHFIPVDNVNEKFCPLHRMVSKVQENCPWMKHDLVDCTFFAKGLDSGLETDFNHANFTPVR